MGYAEVKDQTIINLVVSDPEYAALRGWVEVADSVGMGWVFQNGEWVNPNPLIDSADSVSA